MTPKQSKNCQEKPTITNKCSNNLRRFLLNFWMPFFSGIVKKNRKLSRKSEEMDNLGKKSSPCAELSLRNFSFEDFESRPVVFTPTPKLGNMV